MFGRIRGRRRPGTLVTLAVMATALGAFADPGATATHPGTRQPEAPLASRLARLMPGTPAPEGAAWVMSAASACNRPLPDQVTLDPKAALDYTGGTAPEVLLDADTFGGKWRMAAVTAEGTIVATAEWCTPPAVKSDRPAATAVAGRSLRFCGCHSAWTDGDGPEAPEEAIEHIRW